MAHRGKVYPVAFRRDWNLNVHTNRIGFAKDYNFYYDSLTVGVWPGLVGAVFVCSEQPQSVPDLLEWASDYMPADGYLWRVRMQQRLTSHAPATEQPSTFVDRSDIGNVYEAVIRTAQPGSDFSQDLSAHTVFWDSSVYPVDPAIYLSSIQPKGY